MRALFVDTHFLIARLNPRDPWHLEAMSVNRHLGRNVQFHTTHEVLTEFLSGTARLSESLRHRAVGVVEALLAAPSCTITPPSPDLFLRGLSLLSARLNTDYSLVDCISMVVMRECGIQEVLTNDDHVTREGYTVLIR